MQPLFKGLELTGDLGVHTEDGITLLMTEVWLERIVPGRAFLPQAAEQHLPRVRFRRTVMLAPTRPHAHSVAMDDNSRADRALWTAYPKLWLFEPGGLPVGVLLPLAAALAPFWLDGALTLGVCAVLWICIGVAGWLPSWARVVEIRVDKEAGRLTLRQRYGRTRVHALDSLTELRPVQVGPASWVSVSSGEDDEYEEKDQMVLELRMGKRLCITYNTPHTTAAMARVISALKAARPQLRVTETEFRRPTFVDVERGMSPG